MWQIYALGSLAATAFESVADKFAIVHDSRIDWAVATFWRNALFFSFTLVVGLFGWLGEMHFYFDTSLLLFSLVAVLSSYFYTYLLRRVEVTGIMTEMYFAPLVFLFVDTMILHVPLSAAQIMGVVLLAAGGSAFAFDARTRKVKREISFVVIAIFLFWMFHDGFQFYLFKHLNDAYAVNGVSFLASAYLVVAMLLLLVVMLQGKFRLLFQINSAKYLPSVIVSKFFDAAGSLLWMRALAGASVSQVAAIGALEPLMIFLTAIFVQKETRFNIRERVDHANVLWKLCSIALVCVGMFLVV